MLLISSWEQFYRSQPGKRRQIPARRAATQFHHEGREGHEVLKESICVIFLRVLRVLRGEKFGGRKSGFGKAGESEHQKKSPLCPAFCLNHSSAGKIFSMVVFTCTDLYWLVLACVGPCWQKPVLGWFGSFFRGFVSTRPPAR
jgi:hypothetical protein